MAFLFFGILAMFGFGFWLAALLIFRAGRKRQSLFMTWLGGVPLAFSSLIGAYILGISIYSLIFVSQPANVYEMSSGRAPSIDVTEMQSQYWMFGDSATTYLRFKAAPKTIAILTKGWNEISPQIEDITGDEDEPAWWKPVENLTTQMYAPKEIPTSFSSSSVYLCYDLVTKQAYFYFVGVD